MIIIMYKMVKWCEFGSLRDLTIRGVDFGICYLAGSVMLPVLSLGADWLTTVLGELRWAMRRVLRAHVHYIDWLSGTRLVRWLVDRVWPEVTGRRWGCETPPGGGLAGTRVRGAARVQGVCTEEEAPTVIVDWMFEMTGLPKQWCPVTSFDIFENFYYRGI